MVLLVACVCASSSSAAYVLEKTDSGVVITWPRTCVEWWMQVDGSSQVGPGTSLDVVETSFATWDFLDGHYVDFWERGVTCTDGVGFAGPGGQQNVVMWRDDVWPYAERVVGLTSLSFEPDTGYLADADIELNGADYTFASDGSANKYDLQQAVTHEVGHVLGLGHSELEAAVMFATAGPGAVDKRDLHADDIAGIAASHPATADVSSGGCDLSADPATFDAPYCPEPADGCQAGSSTGGAAAWVILAVLCLFARRRRVAMAVAVATVGLATLAPAAHAQEGCNPYRASLSGEPIYWPIPHMDVTPDETVPDGIDPDRFHDILTEAFGAWTAVECFERTATVQPYDVCPGEVADDGVNCIYWEPEPAAWEAPTWGTGLVAITLVHHYPDTGIIVDTDLAINLTGDFSWSDALECDPDNDVDHDLLATLSHEAGHFFGLDHADIIQTTMHGFTHAGDCTKRGLHQLDMDCICSVYEPHPPQEPEPQPEAAPDAGGTDAGPAGDGGATDGGGGDTGGGARRPGCVCAGSVTSTLPLWLAPVFWLFWLARSGMTRRRRAAEHCRFLSWPFLSRSRLRPARPSRRSCHP